MTHVVLHVGKDTTLLHTRTAVLRRAGYMVVPSSEVADAQLMFEAGDFDLVIVCHSVPAHERETLTKRVHQLSPSTPVILVQGLHECDPFVDATIDNNPAALVEELSRVISQTRCDSLGSAKRIAAADRVLGSEISPQSPLVRRAS